SAREWPLDHYSALIRMLPQEKFNLLVTGTAAEADMMASFLAENKRRITDLTGRFTLQQFIRFIGTADGLIAASTGPLHLAAAMGKRAIGIYPPIRPMHPGRWAPLGKKASYVVVDRRCDDCRKSGQCHCMSEITPEQIMKSLTDDKGT
ncbi:MAG: glycosyltransferase family 9 protein, partial [bacterium]